MIDLQTLRDEICEIEDDSDEYPVKVILIDENGIEHEYDIDEIKQEEAGKVLIYLQ